MAEQGDESVLTSAREQLQLAIGLAEGGAVDPELITPLQALEQELDTEREVSAQAQARPSLARDGRWSLEAPGKCGLQRIDVHESGCHPRPTPGTARVWHSGVGNARGGSGDADQVSPARRAAVSGGSDGRIGDIPAVDRHALGTSADTTVVVASLRTVRPRAMVAWLKGMRSWELVKATREPS